MAENCVSSWDQSSNYSWLVAVLLWEQTCDLNCVLGGGDVLEEDAIVLLMAGIVGGVDCAVHTARRRRRSLSLSLSRCHSKLPVRQALRALRRFDSFPLLPVHCGVYAGPRRR